MVNDILILSGQSTMFHSEITSQTPLFRAEIRFLMLRSACLSDLCLMVLNGRGWSLLAAHLASATSIAALGRSQRFTEKRGARKMGMAGMGSDVSCGFNEVLGTCCSIVFVLLLLGSIFRHIPFLQPQSRTIAGHSYHSSPLIALLVGQYPQGYAVVSCCFTEMP